MGLFLVLVAYSDKKEQQAIINSIKLVIDSYRKDVYERFRKSH